MSHNITVDFDKKRRVGTNGGTLNTPLSLYSNSSNKIECEIVNYVNVDSATYSISLGSLGAERVEYGEDHVLSKTTDTLTFYVSPIATIQSETMELWGYVSNNTSLIASIPVKYNYGVI